MRLKEYAKKFYKDESGMEFLQVAIVVAIVVGLIAGIRALSGKIDESINNASSEVDNLNKDTFKKKDSGND